jgi:diguanylate cyclase (GGDEF)-like protein/PAS domain S-box-containing protein
MTEKKPLILIVDDVPLNVSILSDALIDNYQIKVASSGQTALNIAQRQPLPDLILLDVMMPEMDGFEVCRRLKNNELTAKIPVIFVTAKDSEVDEMDGFEIGAIDYISKPFSIAVTKMRIKQHLEREFQAKQLEQEIREHKLAQEHLLVAGLVYNATSEGMMLTDVDCNIVAVNPAFTKITGYTLEEVKGKNPNILKSGMQDAEFYQEMYACLEKTGTWIGEIWNSHKNGDTYAELLTINTIYDDNGAVHQRVALFSDITQKKKIDELIWRQANYDSLTGLPNRQLFKDRLEQSIKKAKRDNSIVALFFIDLDHFKEINDTKGHDVGDLLLIEAAKRLLLCVRETDTVARLGGDEFTIIFEELVEDDCIERIAKAICNSMKKSFFIENELHYISASVGITLFPDDAIEIADLLKNADQAMYCSKEKGRNCYSYFTQK